MDSSSTGGSSQLHNMDQPFLKKEFRTKQNAASETSSKDDGSSGHVPPHTPKKTPKRKGPSAAFGIVGNEPKGVAKCGSPAQMSRLTERQQLALVMQMTAEEGAQHSPSSTTSESRKSNADMSSGIGRKRNQHGETPLHQAAKRGDLKRCQQLVEQGANVNALDNANWTPLHEACLRGHTEVSAYLLSVGASVNAIGCDGDTPLHDAVIKGPHDLIEVLLKNGANPNLANSKHQTPIHLAESHLASKTCELLLQYSANFPPPLTPPPAATSPPLVPSRTESPFGVLPGKKRRASNAGSEGIPSVARQSASPNHGGSIISHTSYSASEHLPAPGSPLVETDNAGDSETTAGDRTLVRPSPPSESAPVDVAFSPKADASKPNEPADNGLNIATSGTSLAVKLEKPADREKRRKLKGGSNGKQRTLSGNTSQDETTQRFRAGASGSSGGGASTGKASRDKDVYEFHSDGSDDADPAPPKLSPMSASSRLRQQPTDSAATDGKSSNGGGGGSGGGGGGGLLMMAVSRSETKKPASPMSNDDDSLKVPPLKIRLPSDAEGEKPAGETAPEKAGSSGSSRKETAAVKEEPLKTPKLANSSSGASTDEDREIKLEIDDTSYQPETSATTEPLVKAESKMKVDSIKKEPEEAATESSNKRKERKEIAQPAKKRGVRVLRPRPNETAADAPTSSANEGSQNAMDVSSFGACSSSFVSQAPLAKPTNLYKEYMDVRSKMRAKQAELSGKVLNWCPMPPQNIENYTLTTRTYLLNEDKCLNIPWMMPPASLNSEMRRLFEKQEQERYKLRLRHQTERDRLVLLAEHAVLRFQRNEQLHDRLNTSAECPGIDWPLSMCQALKLQDPCLNVETLGDYGIQTQTNVPPPAFPPATPLLSPNANQVRMCSTSGMPFGGSASGSGLVGSGVPAGESRCSFGLAPAGTGTGSGASSNGSDGDGRPTKWSELRSRFCRLKEEMVCRQKHEAESLNAHQKQCWEWTIKRRQCSTTPASSNADYWRLNEYSAPEVDDLSVPMVTVQENVPIVAIDLSLV